MDVTQEDSLDFMGTSIKTENQQPSVSKEKQSSLWSDCGIDNMDISDVDDDDSLIPDESDGEYSDLSDDLDYMLCHEELKDSESFFNDVISRDYRGPQRSEAEIEAELKLALKKNQEMRLKNSELKNKLLLEKENLVKQLLEFGVQPDVEDVSSDSDDLLSFLKSFNDCKDPMIDKDRPSSPEEKVTSHHLGRFYSQFTGSYFKDNLGFSCPPNEDTKRIRAIEKVSVTELMGKCKEWTEKELQAIEASLKKCLIDDYQLKVERHTLRFKQFEYFLKTNPLDAVLEGRNYNFDWLKVSALLSTKYGIQRTPVDCERLWNLYLHPKFHKSDWTAEEESSILRLVDVYSGHNWDIITKELKTNRSVFHVFIHYARDLYFKHTAGKKWTPEEDAQLKKLIDAFTVSGKIPWMKVVYYFEHRSYDQVYNRWNNTLLASKMGKFSVSEDRAIMSAFFQHKINSQLLKKVLNNQRTYKQIRGRLEALQSIREGKVFGEFTLEEDQKLLDLVKTIGTKWSKIAKEYGSRDRTQLRHRYNKLKRKLQDPDFKLEDINRSKMDIRNNLRFRNDQMIKVMNEHFKHKTTSVKDSKKMIKKQNKIFEPGSVESVIDKFDHSPIVRAGMPKTDEIALYLLENGSAKWIEEGTKKFVMSEETAKYTVAACLALGSKLEEHFINLSDEHLEPVSDLLNPEYSHLSVYRKNLFSERPEAGYDDKSKVLKVCYTPSLRLSNTPSTSQVISVSVNVSDPVKTPPEIDLPACKKEDTLLSPVKVNSMESCDFKTSCFTENILFSILQFNKTREADDEDKNIINLPSTSSHDEMYLVEQDQPLETLSVTEGTFTIASSSSSPEPSIQVLEPPGICNVNVLPPSFVNCNAFTNILMHLSKSQHIKSNASFINDSPETVRAKQLWMKRLYQLFLLPAVHSCGRKKKATIAYERTYM